MKKLMTLLFMCSLVLASQAQEVLQLPEGFSGGKTVWIVRAGASFSEVKELMHKRMLGQKTNGVVVSVVPLVATCL